MDNNRSAKNILSIIHNYRTNSIPVIKLCLEENNLTLLKEILEDFRNGPDIPFEDHFLQVLADMESGNNG